MDAEVRRDAYGVPHVLAPSLPALARAQGRVTALDRAWQLEYSRRRATGTTAALLGEEGLPWDRFARRAGLVALARRAFDRLDEESQAFLTAYVAGVAEGLGEVGSVPELDELGVSAADSASLWEPWTPGAVFAAHHMLFATFPTKLWRGHVHSTLTEEVADLIHDEGLWAAQSNAWAVGGSRTASGLPLVAGDPHRTFESPNVYQQVRLTCTDPEDPVDVVGFTFPGLPGVQHFAHAGAVAWGITNAMADYQDVYLERLTRNGADVTARGPLGPEPTRCRVERIEVAGALAEEVEVIVTARGPVVLGGPGEPLALSLRTASEERGDLGLACLVPLLRARSSAAVVEALQGWVEPVNNLVVADGTGDVRHQVVGAVPERAEENRWGPVPAWLPGHEWTGWVVDLPGSFVGPDGRVVTANQRLTPDFDRLGVEFAPPHRADRLDALLEGRVGLTGADMATIQADVQAPRPGVLLDLLDRFTALSPAATALRASLRGWDGKMAADSREAAAYVALRDALVRHLADLPALRGLREPTPWRDVALPLLTPWFAVEVQVWLSLDNLLSPAGRTAVRGIDACLAAALEEVAAGEPGEWGARHRFQPLHVLGHRLSREVKLGGDNDCVRCTGAMVGSEVAARGSVARYVWDLAGWERSGWVVPLGASGDPRSPHHHDQLDAWADVRLLPLPAG